MSNSNPKHPLHISSPQRAIMTSSQVSRQRNKLHSEKDFNNTIHKTQQIQNKQNNPVISVELSNRIRNSRKNDCFDNGLSEVQN